MTDKSLTLIQKLYKSDIRSMINFMQSNQHIKDDDFNIIDETVWSSLYSMIIDKSVPRIKIIGFINTTSSKYNIDKKNIIKDFLNYIIRNKGHQISAPFLNFVENIMHFEDCKNSHYVNYSLSKLSTLLPLSLPLSL